MAWEENSRICLHMQLIAILSRIGVSLMDKTPLVDFFERTDFNNVKELDCPPLSRAI